MLVKLIVVGCAVIASIAFWNPLASWSQTPAPAVDSFMNWRPKQRAAGGARYVGESTCAECHASIAASFKASGMAHALAPAAESRVLRSNPRLVFRQGPFTYRITRQGDDQSIYTVSDGVSTISAPVRWAFGHGDSGQTYVFEHKGTLYESRVSFYPGIKSLDLTIGSLAQVPASLGEAIGRPMTAGEAKDCFSCHATAAVSGSSQLQLDKLSPGVSCEACHGPGDEHVQAMKLGNLKEKRIFNPRTLSGDAISQQFCAACHRSAEEVVSLPVRASVDNVRFQPYRIFNSRCYSDDRRISCTSCHDPHEDLRRDPVYYDAKCLACHLPSSDAKAVLRTGEKLKATTVTAPAADDAPAAIASPHPANTARCVSCHMPKIELPGAHAKFTDHWIRTVKPGEPFPK